MIGIDLPDNLFDDEEAPSDLEMKFLNRKRDADGKLVPRKKRSKRSVGAAVFQKTRAETEEMMRTTEWDGCRASHLVALHDVMHERTYGVPSGMTGTERQTSAKMIGSLVKRAFDGEPSNAVMYFRWLWMREVSTERWRRANNRSGKRLTLGYACSSAAVTDWRVDEQRRTPRQTRHDDAG